MKIPDYSKKRIKKLKEIYNDYVREEDKELIRLTKEVDRLNNIIFEDNNIHNNMELVKRIKNILKGIDLTEKDKRQIKGLKEEFKIGDKE